MNNNKVKDIATAILPTGKQVSRFAKQAGGVVLAAAQYGAGAVIKGTAPMEVKSINPQASSAGKAMFNKNAAYFNSIHGDSSDTKVTHLEGNKGQALLEKGVADLGDALVSSSKKNFKKAFSSEEETQNLKEQAAAGFEALKNKTQKQNDINAVAELLPSGEKDFDELVKQHKDLSALLRSALSKIENKKPLENVESVLKEAFDVFKEERSDYGDAKSKVAFFAALSDAVVSNLYDKVLEETPHDFYSHDKEEVLKYTRMSDDVFKRLNGNHINIQLAQLLRGKLNPPPQEP